MVILYRRVLEEGTSFLIYQEKAESAMNHFYQFNPFIFWVLYVELEIINHF